jgi:chromosome segregation ATPase
VLVDSTRKLRNTINSLRSDVDHREKTVKSLQRSWETLRVEAIEELKGRDASIEDLQNSLKAAAAHHDECYTEIHRLNAAGLEVESVAREFERELRMLRGVEVASSRPGDVGLQVKSSEVVQGDVDQVSEAKPVSPKCATAEDDDEEEL